MIRLFNIRPGFGRLQRFYSGASAKSSAAAEDVIDEMLKRRPLPSIVEFNREIHEISKKGDDMKAIESYKKISRAGVKPSNYTISIIIKSYGNLKFIDRGLSLLGCSMKCGLEIDDHVITSVLKGYVSECRIEEGQSFLEKILSFDERPSSPFMYNVLLKGSCEAEGYQRALEIFNTMHCKPDKIGYTILINHLFEKKQVDEGITMVSRMLSDTNVSLDSKLFGAAIRGLLEQNQSEAARMLLLLMVEKNVRFEASFMNILLGFYVKKHMMKHGEAVVAFMLIRRISPTLVTFNTLLLGYSISHDVTSAEKLYYLMSTGSSPVSPDIVTATTMLSCYCNNRVLVGKGMEFFEKTFGQKDRLFDPNVVTYGTMIKGLFKAGDVDGACLLVSRMKTDGISSSQNFYGMVLDGYLSNGCVEEADSYFRESENDGFNSDVVVWNILIKGAILNKNLDLAKAHKKEMQRRAIQPDEKTYGPLLVALYSRNSTDEADELVSEMRKSGIPIQYAYNDLKRAYQKTREEVEKKSLWNALKKLEKEA